MMQGSTKTFASHCDGDAGNIERGMSAEDARYAAMRKFGNVTLVKEIHARCGVLCGSSSRCRILRLASVAFTVLVTGTLSIAGPVRRALHIDPANCSANNSSQLRLVLDLFRPFQCDRGHPLGGNPHAD